MLTRIKPRRLRQYAPKAVRAACGALAAATALVAGCGFHLEGPVPVGRLMETAHLESVAPHSEFFAALESALSSSGTRVVGTESAAPATLKVLEDTTGQRVLSVSARNIPREYEVYYRVTFALEGDRGVLLEPQSLVATRSYTYDETAVLGKSAEEIEVRRAIAADLARQVVRRIAAVASPPPPPKS